MPGDLAELEDASCPHNGHDHGASNHRNQKHDGGWSVAVESHEVDSGALSVLGNENDQNNQKDYGSDNRRPAGANSSGSYALCSRRRRDSYIVD